MIGKRYQVFVSSTFLDLQQVREEVFRAILNADCIPIGMEMFPPSSDEVRKVILRVLEETDYYMLIVGNRYGTTNASGISWTEEEFNHARHLELPRLVFLPTQPPRGVRRRPGRNSQESRAAEFSLRVQNTHPNVAYWDPDSPSKLAAAVGIGLTGLQHRNPRDGWVRASRAVDLQHAALIHDTAQNVTSAVTTASMQLTRCAEELKTVGEQLQQVVSARQEIRDYSSVLQLKASLAHVYRLTVEELLSEPLKVLSELATAQLHVEEREIERAFRILLAGIRDRYDGVSSSDISFWREADGHRYLQVQGQIATVHPTTRLFVLSRDEFSSRKGEVRSILEKHADMSIGWAIAFREDIPVPTDLELDFGLFDGQKAVSYFFRKRRGNREYDVIFHTQGQRVGNDAEIAGRVQLYELILGRALIVSKHFAAVHMCADDLDARGRLTKIAVTRQRRVKDAGIEQRHPIFPIVVSDEKDLSQKLDGVLRIAPG